jgi:hypothetical protein
MTGSALAMAARVVLGAVFLFSAGRKKSSGAEFVATVKAFGLPAPALTAGVLTAVEVALALGLLGWRDEPWPSVAALAVLGLFTAAVWRNLQQGRVVPCPCFGAGDRPISTATLTRNGFLAAVAILGTGSSTGAEGAGVAVTTAVLGVVTVAVIRRTG